MRASNTRLHHRGSSYDELKAQIQARVLEALLRALLGARGAVERVDLGTPLSNNFFLGNSYGEAYRLDHSAAHFGAPWLRPSTPIRGLYLTGQDIMCDSVAGAAASALLSASCLEWGVPIQQAIMLIVAAAATAAAYR